MMRPTRSKHGLDRKYKPWRKGKSSSSKNSKPRGDDDENGGDNRRRPTSSGTTSSSHTNASLKNMLRSQKRLLDKLERGGYNQTSTSTSTTNNNREALIDATKQKIHQLEQDIRAHEAREREKKNAVKYHQVKFIERQKITRLEKSVKRQLQQLLLEQQQQKQQNSDYSEDAKFEQTQQQISLLQQQLQSIAMDQLYIAFFPTNMKYMALFTNGMNRVVDDERGQKRRKAVWNVIREGLLAESEAAPMEEQERMQQMKSHDGSNSSSSSSGGGSDDDSSSVPSDDSDSEMENESGKKAEGINADESAREPNNKLSLKNAKTWVNLAEAKRALLSMPVDTYPNDPSIVVVSSASGSAQSNQQKNKAPKNDNEAKRSLASTELNSYKGKKGSANASDSRFELSKGLEGLFHESTTGDDYREELLLKPDDGSGASSDESTSSDSDDGDENGPSSDDDDDSADPLKSSVSEKQKSSAKSTSLTSSSSSSSEDSDDSDESDNNSDSDADTKPKHNQELLDNNQKTKATIKERETEDIAADSDKSGDDFFSNDKVSTEDIFNQIQNEKKKAHHASGRGRHDDIEGELNRNKTKRDKSLGFKSQNQSKRDYRSFQNRQKRQKFG